MTCESGVERECGFTAEINMSIKSVSVSVIVLLSVTVLFYRALLGKNSLLLVAEWPPSLY